MVASASVWVAAPAQATSCSITAYDPTSNGTTVTAHVLLNCNGPLTGWVKSTLVRVRTGLPDAVVASNTDSTQNSSYNFVGAHVIPGSCAHGFPQVVGPWCCSTG
jgi:hypothetical protein